MEQKILDNKLKELHSILNKVERFNHMANVISYDLETQCPQKGMDENNEDLIEIDALAFKLVSSKKYKNLVIEIHENIDSIDNIYDKRLINVLYKKYLSTKNVTSSQQRKFSATYSKAYTKWIKAKEKGDYKDFRKTLEEIVKTTNKELELSEKPKLATKLDDLMDNYEEGMTTELLDSFFNELKEAIVPLLVKIKNSDTKIRTDFLNRYVPEHKQLQFAKYLLEVIGYDLSRGSLGLTEHPFTSSISENDHRVTTHIHENNFISNIYSIIHEGGHGIFGQNIPHEAYIHHCDQFRSLGEDESVSRFFENRIGRSKEFIHLIYPKFKEIFFEEFNDVSEEELYNAVNVVEPGLIRTEADELTYTLHIIIRYELEKEIVNNNISLKDLNKLWNQKYKDYLGVEVPNDKEGVLQDVHRTSGFGYFPTYAIGNAYNAMYFNKMKESVDVSSLILNNNIREIVSWMKENIFKSACAVAPNEWLKEITGRTLDATDFKNYLVEKYSEIYKL